MRFTSCLLIALGWSGQISYAGSEEFRAVTGNLIGYSTVRETVDIEIVGSKEVGPRQYVLEPARTLRLRVERAYVGNFLKQSTSGAASLTLHYDQPTGLPQTLINAVSTRGRFHQDIPGVPDLGREEGLRRHIVLDIKGDSSVRHRPAFFEKANACVGEAVGNELFEMTLGTSADGRVCSRSIYPGSRKFLARSGDTAVAVIECHGDDQWEIGCSTEFDFDGFFVQIRFHRSRVTNWREMIASARSFLLSSRI